MLFALLLPGLAFSRPDIPKHHAHDVDKRKPHEAEKRKPHEATKHGKPEKPPKRETAHNGAKPHKVTKH